MQSNTRWAGAIIALAMVTVLIFGYAIGDSGFEAGQYIIIIAVFIAIFVSPRLGMYVMLFLTPLHALFLLPDGSTLVRAIGMPTFAAWLARKLVL